MGTIANWILGLLVDQAYALGPSAGLVLPTLGILAGLVFVGGGYAAWQQRLRRHARVLAARARRRIPRGEEGRRVVLVGRLRVAGHERVTSYVDGAPVAVSTLWRNERGVTRILGTRRALGLAVETDDGLVPIEGAVHLESTLAAEVLVRTPDMERTALAARAGELVVVEGRLGRVATEGLRGQGAVAAITSDAEEFGQLPIRLTTLRLEVPRLLPQVTLAGALAFAVLFTPWPGAGAIAPRCMLATREPTLELAAWRMTALVQLLGPWRSELAGAAELRPGVATRASLPEELGPHVLARLDSPVLQTVVPSRQVPTIFGDCGPGDYVDDGTRPDRVADFRARYPLTFWAIAGLSVVTR